jgi:hypothetical protein
MNRKLYYVDTCIWLNLLKKEGDATKGVPYWKIAEDFFQSCFSSSDKEILCSVIVVRELELQLNTRDYYCFLEVINKKNIKIVAALEEDKRCARKLESFYNFTISYYGLLHMTIAKRWTATLITRDKLLLQKSKENNIFACRPEDLSVC